MMVAGVTVRARGGEESGHVLFLFLFLFVFLTPNLPCLPILGTYLGRYVLPTSLHTLLVLLALSVQQDNVHTG